MKFYYAQLAIRGCVPYLSVFRTVDMRNQYVFHYDGCQYASCWSLSRGKAIAIFGLKHVNDLRRKS